jgi:hypothetical protein
MRLHYLRLQGFSKAFPNEVRADIDREKRVPRTVFWPPAVPAR